MTENTPTVLYEKDGRIARLTLSRPEKLNAINETMPDELSTAVATLFDGMARHTPEGAAFKARAEAVDFKGEPASGHTLARMHPKPAWRQWLRC
jgi:enoyl-CoA hydratase